MMAMYDNLKNWRLLTRTLVVAGLGLSLGGCGTSGGSTEDRVGRLLTAPDKFIFFTCGQLEGRAATAAARQKQLEQLMAKAGTSLDGRLISVLAYQSEHTELVADLNELRRAAAEKNCKPTGALARPADKPAR